MGLENVFGTLGTFTAISIGIAPAPSFYKGLKEKEIKSVALSFLLFGIFNCGFWTSYGLKDKQTFVMMSNGIMFVLFLIYFNLHNYINNLTHKNIIQTVGFLAVIIAAYLILPATALGFISFLINTAWTFTSLIPAKKALETKDASFINLPIAGVSALNGVCWMFYSILVKDPFVGIPNFCALVLWSFNFVIYYWALDNVSDDNFIIVFLNKVLGVNSGYQKMDDNNKEKYSIEKGNVTADGINKNNNNLFNKKIYNDF
jgi:solute carrier family 50 protein (sugar transporter)